MFGDTTSYYPLMSNVPVDAPIGVLSDQELFKIALQIGGNWQALARELMMTPAEIRRIERTHLPDEHGFAMLLDWRYKCVKLIRVHDSVIELANALETYGRRDLSYNVLMKYQSDNFCA
ncbi:uncharacterized protein LOC144440319 [Glandiceps talaboti]